MKKKQTSYVIPGVPYFGIYNHKGRNADLGYDTSTSLAIIFEYWNPSQKDFKDIKTDLNQLREDNPNKKISGIDEVLSYINSLGQYQATQKRLEVNELKKYVNAKTRTPLLVSLALDERQPPEVQYYPLNVVIGVNEVENKIILHNCWLGNNYELSFNRFETLQAQMHPDFRNQYLIIQPKDLNEKLKEIRSRNHGIYTLRTEIMQKAEKMFALHAIGKGAIWNNNFEVALKFFEMVEKDPAFQEYFPPVFKMRLFASMAFANLQKNDLDSALEKANQAAEIDHNLDKPFKDWPGYDFCCNNSAFKGVETYPYEVLGQIYERKGELEKARENYQKATDINPQDSVAQLGIHRVEFDIANKK